MAMPKLVPGNALTLAGLHGDMISLQPGVKATTFALADAELAGVTDIETVQLVGKAAFTLTLGANSEESGIAFVDAAPATGNVKVDASGRLDGIEVDFTSKGLTATDVVKGSAGFDDAIGIVDKAAVTDAAFANITGVEMVIVRGDPSITDYTGAKITLGAKSDAAGIDGVYNETDYALTVDASASKLLDSTYFSGNIGDDVFIASPFGDGFDGHGGDDTLVTKLTDADVAYGGGAGSDTLKLTGAFDAKNAAQAASRIPISPC